MRRTSTNEIVVLIAAMLVAAALGFAWLRTRTMPSDSADVRKAPHEDRAGVEFDWQALGARTYGERCASCHGDGEATRRVPPLRVHAVRVFESGDGRGYLAAFLLDGRAGAITVNTNTYEPRHPTYRDRLSNEEVAAVLNHMLTAWGNDALLPQESELYTPQFIQEYRERGLTAEEVQLLRPDPR